MSAHGPVLVVIHSEVTAPARSTEKTGQLVRELAEEGVERALVFMNASEGGSKMIGSWRTTLEPLVWVPQGLGSLA